MNQSIIEEKHLKQLNTWKRITYSLLILKILLAITTLSLNLELDNFEITKRYVGLAQTIAGIILSILLTVSIYFSYSILILVYATCCIIISVTCLIMFIFMKVSENLQIYDGPVPFLPAHPKIWYQIYNAYFICSITLACYSLLVILFVIKTRKLIAKINKNGFIRLESDCKEKNQQGSLTNEKTDSVAKRSFSGNEAPFSNSSSSDEESPEGPLVISYNQKELKVDLNRAENNTNNKTQEALEDMNRQVNKVKREQLFYAKPDNYLYRVDEEAGREDSDATDNEFCKSKSSSNELSYSINNSEERVKPYKLSPNLDNYIEKGLRSPLLGLN